jgi:CRP-like cAMP-binding protein
MTSHKKILDLISNHIRPDEKDVAMVKELFEPFSCEAGTLLEREGKAAKYLYFVNTGFIRTFHFMEGSEITTHINCPPGFITSFHSFTNRTPAFDNVEAVTPADLLRITKQNLDLLYSQSNGWAEFGRVVYEKSLGYNEERSMDMITLTAEQRYLKLLEKQPEIVRNVPLKYISSYLGIEPQSLSRIRRKITS